MTLQELSTEPMLAHAPLAEGYRVVGGIALYDKLADIDGCSEYVGRHLRLNIDVVARMIPAHLDGDGAAVESQDKEFLARAQQVAPITHQNLVRILDVDTLEGARFIATEYVDGESASDALSEKKLFSEAEALQIVGAVAGGLAALHAKGITHGNVKPSSILLGHDGSIKLARIGLSGAADAHEVTGSPDSDAVGAVAAHAHLAPELLESPGASSARSDVWALGISLFQMITGRLPWPADNVSALVHKICNEDLPNAPEPGDSVTAIIRKAVSKDPTERYADAAGLATDVAGQLESLGVSGALEFPRKRLASEAAPDASTLDSIRASFAQGQRHRFSPSLPGTPPPRPSTSGTMIVPHKRAHAPRGLVIAVAVATVLGLALIPLTALGVNAYLNESLRTQAMTDLAEIRALMRKRELESALDKATAGALKYIAPEYNEQFTALEESLAAAIKARDDTRERENLLKADCDELVRAVRQLSAEGKFEQARGKLDELEDLCDKGARGRYLLPGLREGIAAAEQKAEDLRLADMCRRLIAESEKFRTDKELERAIEKLSEVLELNAGHKEAEALLKEVEDEFNAMEDTRERLSDGLTYWREQKLDEAEEAFNKAVDLAPPGSDDLASAKTNLAHVRYYRQAKEAERRGDLTAAADLYEKAYQERNEPLSQEAYTRLRGTVSRREKLARVKKLTERKDWNGLEPVLADLWRENREDMDIARLLMEARHKSTPSPTLTIDLADDASVELVYVKAGWFPMGHNRRVYPGEGPAHEVTLNRGFYIGKTEVTVDQFRRFIDDARHRTTAKEKGWSHVRGKDRKWRRRDELSWQSPGHEQTDDHAVVCISWHDAAAFCSWLSKKELRNCRLPTEAEWEYVCRAGTTSEYHWGNEPELAGGWCNASTVRSTDGPLDALDAYINVAPVGSLKRNAWGLHDMHGNVWEWCQDWYSGSYYAQGAMTDPTGPSTGKEKVIRGGAYNVPIANYLQSAHRGRREPDFSSSCIGFRIVIEP